MPLGACARLRMRLFTSPTRSLAVEPKNPSHQVKEPTRRGKRPCPERRSRRPSPLPPGRECSLLCSLPFFFCPIYPSIYRSIESQPDSLRRMNPQRKTFHIPDIVDREQAIMLFPAPPWAKSIKLNVRKTSKIACAISARPADGRKDNLPMPPTLHARLSVPSRAITICRRPPSPYVWPARFIVRSKISSA